MCFFVLISRNLDFFLSSNRVTKSVHNCPYLSQSNQVEASIWPILMNQKDVINRILCCFQSKCSHFDPDNEPFGVDFKEWMKFFMITNENYIFHIVSINFLWGRLGFLFQMNADLLTLYLRVSLSMLSWESLNSRPLKI